MEDKLLSIPQVAETCDCTTSKIHRHIRRGYLKAEKIGWSWVVKESDLLVYIASRKKG